MRDDKHVMTANEVAEYLGLNRETVYLYAKNGKLPAFKVGYAWRFKKESLDRWVSEQENKYKKGISDHDAADKDK